MLTNFSTKQVLARMGFGAPSNTACFELGLQCDLMAAKKIPSNYCELTLHAIFTKLIGSLHNILKIINRPGVAVAVLQSPPSLTYSFID